MVLRLLDTFSGIGGFSYAAEQLVGGYETVAFVEREPFCQRVLQRHWPSVPIFDDICTFNPEPGAADVICGGFPCQDISQAGKQAGIKEGTRSGLFYELMRVIRLVRPRFVVLENVAAITSNGLDTVLTELATAGFDAEWSCIRASDVGACHRRDRWWCVAYQSRRETLLADSSGLRSERRGKACHMAGQAGTSQIDGQERQWNGDAADNRGADAPYPHNEGSQGRQPAGMCQHPQQRTSWPGDPPGGSLQPDWRSYVSEPVLRRGDDGLSARLDEAGRLINEANDSQSIAAACELGEQVLRDMWQRQSTSAAPQHILTIGHSDSLPTMPCSPAYRRRNMGQGTEGFEQVSQGLRDLWRSLSGEAFKAGEDMFFILSQRAGQVERWQTLANAGRVDRLKALGNAVVPQVAAIPLERVKQLAIH